MGNHLIATAIESQDIAELMAGYVQTLHANPSPDRQTILEFLYGQMFHAQGNLELAESIAEHAYQEVCSIERGDRASWQCEREAIAGAYLQLVQNAWNRGDLELAEDIAGSACDVFALGGEAVAARKVYGDIRCHNIGQRASGRLGTERRPTPGLEVLAARVRVRQNQAGLRQAALQH